MRRISGVVGIIMIGIVTGVGAWWLQSGPAASPAAQRVSIAGAITGTGMDLSGFKLVLQPDHQWQFPADHGKHVGYANEWWYWTGNLQSADGRQWGYQLTFFRTGTVASPAPRDSAFGASEIYLAHATLTDVTGQRFYAASRTQRGSALGLAGAAAAPFKVFLGPWQAVGGANAMQPGGPVQLSASTAEFALSLATQVRYSPILHGDTGVLQKSDGAGHASFYYSIPQQQTSGTLTVGGEQVAVTGTSWMDHEWGSNQLGANQIGWNWFSLEFDDGQALMWYEMLRKNLAIDAPFTEGSAIPVGGAPSERLMPGDVTVTVELYWTSPHSGARYPSQWHLVSPRLGLDVRITPLLADQELNVGLTYWEGAVQFSGTQRGQPVSGRGYIEMAGYADVPLGQP